MKLVILYSIVVLCLSEYVNACNQCGLASNVACFSTTQYFKCNAALQIDISTLYACPGTGVCSDTALICSGAPPSCPVVVALTPTPMPPMTTPMTPMTTPTTPMTTPPTPVTTPTIPMNTPTTPVTTPTTPVTTPTTPMTTPTTPVTTPTTPMTTPTTPVTTVATITSANATAWCQNKAPGRYAQPGDKTCTNYVYCYLNGGTMGWVYSCIGTTLFNPITSSCQPNYACP